MKSYFKLRYSKSPENTELSVELNRDDTDKQDSPSPSLYVRIVRYCSGLVISLVVFVFKFFLWNNNLPFN
ncbi:hypothetical protein CGK62_01890 [Vibrio parahaemolyticus]|nr:hypothetical protein CGK62_01890 [Vibrio parahaemolyticus]